MDRYNTRNGEASGNSADEDENFFKSFFEEGDESEKNKQEERCKTVQQQGFQAVSFTERSILEELQDQISLLETNAKTRQEKWFTLYETFIKRTDTKLNLVDEEIKGLKEGTKIYDSDITIVRKELGGHTADI